MYCECGCGEPTTICNSTDSRSGAIKGEPHRFLRGHHRRGLVDTNCPAYKGGKRKTNKGYVIVLMQDTSDFLSMSFTIGGSRYGLLHRLVMADHLNRTLTKEEVVHHINGIKDDNRIENLQLFDSTGPHTSLHKRERDRCNMVNV